LVDDPVASGEEPFTGYGRGFLHGLGARCLSGRPRSLISG
jgi:hypothetical protein